MRQVFDIAIEHGARYSNPAEAVQRMCERRKELKLPTADQFNAIVAAIQGAGVPHCRESDDLVRLLAFTGLRKMKAANLLWKDVDFDRGELIVRGDPETGTKNSEVRRVPLIPEARALLGRMFDRRRIAREDVPVARVEDVRKALANGCKQVGVPAMTHHDLRHLFCTRCLEAGVPVPTVAAWAGHKDGGALLLRTYSHLRSDHSAEMAKRVIFTPPAAENVIEMPEHIEAL